MTAIPTPMIAPSSQPALAWVVCPWSHAGQPDALQRWRDAHPVVGDEPARRARPLGGNINTLLGTPDGALWVGSEFGLYRLAPGSGALSEAGAELPRSSVLGLLRNRQNRLLARLAPMHGDIVSP